MLSGCRFKTPWALVEGSGFLQWLLLILAELCLSPSLAPSSDLPRTVDPDESLPQTSAHGHPGALGPSCREDIERPRRSGLSHFNLRV